MLENKHLEQIKKSKYEAAEILKNKMFDLANESDYSSWLISLSNLLADELSELKVRNNLMIAELASKQTFPVVASENLSVFKPIRAIHLEMGESFFGQGWNDSEMAPGIDKMYRWSKEETCSIYLNLSKGHYDVEVHLLSCSEPEKIRCFINKKEVEYEIESRKVLTLKKKLQDSSDGMNIEFLYPVKVASDTDARMIGFAVTDVVAYPASL